ncbi:hypothetical protein ACOMCU_08470 [Lysinibacillus sp. UGB7]|uniref:hypothetical protein n=1 Tax=Lysinibacillus sp. UGB7 TaxID=3411039 RepID=UPI003B781989
MVQNLMSENDDSGIRSLSGFAYQMRVFIYYMSLMKEEGQIEFETLDDVVLSNNAEEKLKDETIHINSVYSDSQDIYAIQVKRTTITNATKKKLIYNWLLLQHENKNISKYILYTEESYGNKDDIFNETAKPLFEEIIKSDKKSNALVSRVKQLYIDNFEQFKCDYEEIINKFEFISEKNIDEKIFSSFSIHFNKGAVSEIIYILRIKALIKEIMGDILLCIDKGQPFICLHTDMTKKIESITQDISDKRYEPDFSTFKKYRRIDLNESEIISSREYVQLKKCNLTDRRIEEHLIYQQYYEDIRDRYLLDSKLNKVENIESISYENFCCVKEELQDDIDTPLKRLNKTKAMSNSYSLNDHTKFGSCIYLTKEDIEELKKISWEDE